MRPVSQLWDVRKPWETASGRAGEPAVGDSVGASESLADVPQDPRLPSYPPVGPTDRLHDLYGSLSRTFGINRSGRLHGGVLATVIDAACGFAGCYEAPPGRGRRAMTLSLNTQYIGPVPLGTRLTASARRTGGGHRIFFSTCEVRDRDGRLVATGSATYRYRGDA